MRMGTAGYLVSPGISTTSFLYISLVLDLLLFSTGSAGIIQTIQRFSHGALVAGVLGVVATVGWAVQGLGNAFYYRQVIPPQSRCCTAIHTETDLGTSWRCWSHNGKGKLRCQSVTGVY
jgi:hypothetical protein